MNKGWLMTPEVAEKFFKRCQERNANTQAERIKIMNELLHEEDIKVLKEDQIKDVVKGKNVVHFKMKDKGVVDENGD